MWLRNFNNCNYGYSVTIDSEAIWDPTKCVLVGLRK